MVLEQTGQSPVGPTSEDKEIQEGKIFAVLGYIGILCLIPLILKKDNRFALFHAKQGLVLFIAEVVVGILGVLPYLGLLIRTFGTVVFGLLSIVCIIRALMGEYWKIPVVSEIAAKINF